MYQAALGCEGRLRLLRGYMNRCMVASTCLILIMCLLFDTVARILRACGVPWTGARRRYVLVYCAMRHLQGRKCARSRDVCNVVSVLLGDYMAVGARGQPSRGLLHALWTYETAIVNNVRGSPYFAPGPPGFNNSA